MHSIDSFLPCEQLWALFYLYQHLVLWTTLLVAMPYFFSWNAIRIRMYIYITLMQHTTQIRPACFYFTQKQLSLPVPSYIIMVKRISHCTFITWDVMWQPWENTGFQVSMYIFNCIVKSSFSDLHILYMSSQHMTWTIIATHIHAHTVQLHMHACIGWGGYALPIPCLQGVYHSWRRTVVLSIGQFLKKLITSHCALISSSTLDTSTGILPSSVQGLCANW